MAGGSGKADQRRSRRKIKTDFVLWKDEERKADQGCVCVPRFGYEKIMHGTLDAESFAG